MMEFLKLHITFVLELINLNFTENFPKKKENFEISSNISLSLARFGGSRRYVQFSAVVMSSFRPSLWPTWTEKICYSSSDHRLSLVLGQGLQFLRYRRFKICNLHNYKLFSKKRPTFQVNLWENVGSDALGMKMNAFIQAFYHYIIITFYTPIMFQNKKQKINKIK